jgi:hypothetical protein
MYLWEKKFYKTQGLIISNDHLFDSLISIINVFYTLITWYKFLHASKQYSAVNKKDK